MRADARKAHAIGEGSITKELQSESSLKIKLMWAEVVKKLFQKAGCYFTAPFSVPK